MGIWNHVHSQNLVPNPGFETYSSCPTGFGTGGLLECVPWQNGNLATSDNFNACAVGTDVWVPDNLFGSQPAHTGNGYGGCFMREISIWREYLQAPLLSPCLAGVTYNVSFYVSLADFYCGVTNIGAHISVTPPPGNTIGTLPVTPQVEANLGFINNPGEWVLITGCFTAQGGEAWITIGNFESNANTPIDPSCSVSPFSYYYVDDVSVVEGDPANPLDLELGDPVTTCVPYEIDPGVTDVDFHWSDGSSGETLVVTESGVYALTITSGCDVGIDSVEIIFEGSDPVEIGPSFTSFCEGETYTISLDPGAGDYLWQDGSVNAEYVITTSGVYVVTLDDGCDITSDAVTVEVIAVPEPFSLGDDADLCDGDVISFSFDPSLGNFEWQDGSTASSYTITTEGLYALTISNACGEAADEVQVNYITAPQVDLGDAQLQFCEGEPILLQYNFDPSIGNFVWQDGSTASSYSITQAGEYGLTVSNACGTSNDGISILVMNLPSPFSLGHDTSLCEGEELVFSFDPGLGNFAWQDGSDESTYSISSSGLYSLTISNECGEVSDDILVSQSAGPAFNLGDDVAICEGESFEIHLDENAGEYIWHDGSTSADYVISTPGVYSATLTNSCGSTADVIEVTGLNSPTVMLPPDSSVCSSQFPVQLESISTNATGYLWQDNSSSSTFLANQPGLYAITVTNQCGEASDSILITVQPALAKPDLGPDFSLCPGETFMLQLDIPGVNFLWQDLSTSDSMAISVPGTYALTISDECSSASDTVVIASGNTAPDLELPVSIGLCNADTLILESNISGVQFLWNDGSTNSSLAVMSPGTYSLTVSNGCGMDTDTIVVIDAGSAPTIEVDSLFALCEGDTLHLSPIVMNAQNILWQDGSTNQNYQVISAGVYIVSAGNACGTITDSVIVAGVLMPESFSLGPDTSICPGEVVTLSVENVTGEFAWFDGSTSPNMTIGQPGQYFASASNQCGQVADTINIQLLEAIPQLDLGLDQSLCPGEIIHVNPGLNDVDYVWQDGSTGSSLSVSQPGDIMLTITNACGSSSDTLHISLDTNGPELELGPDITVCEGEVVVLESPILGVDYEWQDGSIGQDYLVTASGTYILKVSNACGSDVDSVEVRIEGKIPFMQLGPDTILCDGDILRLKVDADSLTDVVWQDGSAGNSFDVAVPGTFFVTASNQCGESADSIVVDMKAAPQAFDLGPDTTLCPGEFILLVASQADNELVWQDGSHSPELIADQQQVYSLVIRNECGEASDEIEITFDTRIPVIDIQNEFLLCPDEEIVLDVTQSFDADYHWSNEEDIPSISISEAGEYTVTISTTCATVEKTIAILQDDACSNSIYIPNVFSPNHDGINDEFSISRENTPADEALSCSIFDRWGNLVFKSNDPLFKWDGTYNEQPLLPGVYVYMIDVKRSMENKLRRYSGDVTIVK